jgi:hypothetical protein
MMSKKPKDRKQKTLKKIREREEDRLGSSSVVYTNAFSARQTFGSASEVRQINPNELSAEELERLVSL